MKSNLLHILGIATLIAFTQKAHATKLTIQNDLTKTSLEIWWAGHGRIKSKMVEPGKKFTLTLKAKELSNGPLWIATGQERWTYQPNPTLKSKDDRLFQIDVQNGNLKIRQLTPEEKDWIILEKTEENP